MKGAINLTVGHLAVLHLQLELILECVDLFGEDFPNVLLSLVDIVVADRVYDKLLELDKFICACCRYLICHLLVVVLKFSDLLQFTNV